MGRPTPHANRQIWQAVLASVSQAGYHSGRYRVGGTPWEKLVSVLDFANIVKFFKGSEPNEAEQRELFKEATMMVLARATSADTNIKQVEVDQVQALMKEATGQEFSAGDIRTAAKSELFESQPLEKYLSGVARKLNNEDRIQIISLLRQVVHSDDRVSYMEVDYFNLVCRALNATPADVIGMVADEY